MELAVTLSQIHKVERHESSKNPVVSMEDARMLPVGIDMRMLGYPLVYADDEIIVFVRCPYCGVIRGGVTNRWHGVNCARCDAPVKY